MLSLRLSISYQHTGEVLDLLHAEDPRGAGNSTIGAGEDVRPAT
jgi:hypothetical protein